MCLRRAFVTRPLLDPRRATLKSRRESLESMTDSHHAII
jgi:hypothetical protein